LRPKIYWDRRARGLGGRITSCGEENLLGFPGDPYAGENILIHEFAHALHHVALRELESGFQEALEGLHRRALAEGRWSGTYEASNPEEYWAEGVQSWFDCDRENDASHNHVNTREELELYDPGLARLCARVFGPNPWCYRRPGERPPEARVHLGDFDPGRARRFRWPDPPLGERVVVRFDLAAGSLEAELYPRQAPRTVRHFLTLVRDGFYRGGILIWVPAGGAEIKAGFWEGRTDPSRATELPPPLTWEWAGQVGPEHARGTIWWVLQGPAEPAERFRIGGGEQVLQSVPGAEPAGSGTRLTALGRVIRGLDLLEQLRDDAASGLPARAGLRLQGVYRLE
jgi:cyclophilin family peptidyl-prolyl cis-trans isomerase